MSRPTEAIRRLAACGLLWAAAATQAAPAAVHPGDAAAGRAKADDERCTECHVARDPATAQPGDGLHALLDGQTPGYLARQMADFRSGLREHAVMTLVAINRPLIVMPPTVRVVARLVMSVFAPDAAAPVIPDAANAIATPVGFEDAI